ncbi:acyl-CoA dehydratase activase [Chloroflexota bacterium]
MAFFMGVDIGSVTTKGVITGDSRPDVGHIIHSGGNYRLAAEKLRQELLEKAGLNSADIDRTVITGSGGGNITFGDHTVADLRCCAKGIHRLFPEAGIVLDVQGQYSQVISLGDDGRLINFAVSEKCASGSGRFLEIIANVLRINIEDLGPLSLESENPVAFSTGCAVFGESEAVSRVAEGIPKEDIIAGVHLALAGKISSLVDRVGFTGKPAISGGGGLDTGLIKAIEKKLGTELLVPGQPRLVNALGAAIIAGETG